MSERLCSPLTKMFGYSSRWSTGLTGKLDWNEKAVCLFCWLISFHNSSSSVSIYPPPGHMAVWESSQKSCRKTTHMRKGGTTYYYLFVSRNLKCRERESRYSSSHLETMTMGHSYLIRILLPHLIKHLKQLTWIMANLYETHPKLCRWEFYLASHSLTSFLNIGLL